MSSTSSTARSAPSPSRKSSMLGGSPLRHARSRASIRSSQRAQQRAVSLSRQSELVWFCVMLETKVPPLRVSAPAAYAPALESAAPNAQRGRAAGRFPASSSPAGSARRLPARRRPDRQTTLRPFLQALAPDRALARGLGLEDPVNYILILCTLRLRDADHGTRRGNSGHDLRTSES